MREIKFRAWDKIKKEYELLDSMFELQKMNLVGEDVKIKSPRPYNLFRYFFGQRINTNITQ